MKEEGRLGVSVNETYGDLVRLGSGVTCESSEDSNDGKSEHGAVGGRKEVWWCGVVESGLVSLLDATFEAQATFFLYQDGSHISSPTMQSIHSKI